MIAWLSARELTTFLLASLVLGISPGPGVLYIITRSLMNGRRSGLVSAAAMAIGNLACGFVVALGLSAMAALSATLLVALRYAGAAYLVYLGIRLLFARPRPTGPASTTAVSQQRIFLDGLLVALLNPKTLVFFAAFLPQFMDAGGSPLLQGSVLVTLFVLIAFTTDSSYALAAGWIAAPLLRSDRMQVVGRLLGGGILVALGIAAVVSAS